MNLILSFPQFCDVNVLKLYGGAEPTLIKRCLHMEFSGLSRFPKLSRKLSDNILNYRQTPF